VVEVKDETVVAWEEADVVEGDGERGRGRAAMVVNDVVDDDDGEGRGSAGSG
jgi:hypothetical protein